jgi:hypothetical protein
VPRGWPRPATTSIYKPTSKTNCYPFGAVSTGAPDTVVCHQIGGGGATPMVTQRPLGHRTGGGVTRQGMVVPLWPTQKTPVSRKIGRCTALGTTVPRQWPTPFSPASGKKGWWHQTYHGGAQSCKGQCTPSLMVTSPHFASRLRPDDQCYRGDGALDKGWRCP